MPSLAGMASNFSMLDIMNAALVNRGLDEIVSENDGTAEFRLMSRNWPLIVESELEDGAYDFSRIEATLSARVPGKFGFEDGYVLPLTALHVRHVFLCPTGASRMMADDWGQDSTAVYINGATGCVIEMVTVSDPSIWSANFSTGVRTKLEALIARALEGEMREAEALEAQAESHFQRARTKAAKARKARDVLNRQGSIASARLGRGSH